MIAIFKRYHEYIWKNLLCKHQFIFKLPKNVPKTSTKNLYKSSAMDFFKKGQKKNLTFQLHFGLIWTKTNYRESPDT